MRRPFLCHRCGAANQPTAETCTYCGLQIGWRPHFPAALRFWHWPPAQRDTAGATSAILAALLTNTLSLTALALPFLAVSALLLTWSFLTDTHRQP